jgi:hypothetical protein
MIPIEIIYSLLRPETAKLDATTRHGGRPVRMAIGNQLSR